MAGVARFLVIICFIVFFSYVNSEITNLIDDDVLTTQAFMFWPNATVPFYIDTNHFDEEQITILMAALSLFAFKTCIKFAPVLAQPQDNDHVLTFENPTGLRKCELNMEPHTIGDMQKVVLGYDCLKSPEIYMVIMKELGFPFEHNRAVRDLYIEVQTENIEPGYLDLFVKDLRLPLELRSIPYDRNSVLHFGEREYSKNGHKTIIFKDRNFRQERFGLSPIDLRKIEIVYGPECKKRDRQEKVELCQNYPGVARKKREATTRISLRVNPDITPPPEIIEMGKVQEPNVRAKNNSGHGSTDKLVEELGIVQEIEDLISQVHKTAGVALHKAREKFCNGSKKILRTDPQMEKTNDNNILGIINEIAMYSKTLVDKAMKNFTEFCAPSKSMDDYQRDSCPFFNKDKCRHRFKSTKSGSVVYSTQHRPIMKQYTKHYGSEPKQIYENMFAYSSVRAGPKGNETASDATNATNSRPKREESDATNSNATNNDATKSDATNSNATKSDASNSDVTKSELRANTRKIFAHGNIYAPKYRASPDTNLTLEEENKGLTGKTGKAREKREVATQKANETTTPPIELARVSTTKFIPKQTFYKSTGNGSKILKRRFQSRKYRVRKVPVPGEEAEEILWGDSELTLENEAEDGPTAAKPKKMIAGQSKPGSLYHEHKPAQKTGLSQIGSAETMAADAETKAGAPGSISEENILKTPSQQSYSKLVQPASKKTILNRAKTEQDATLQEGTKNQVPVETELHKVASADDIKQDGNVRASDLPMALVVSIWKTSTTTTTSATNSPLLDIGSTYKSSVKQRKVKIHAAKKSRPRTTTKQPWDPESGLPKTVELTEKNAEFYNERKWPDNTVRYLIHDTGDFNLEDCRVRLAEVNDVLRQETCVELEEITEAQTDLYEDYLVLDNSPDYVTGRVGGRQNFGVVDLLKGGQHRQHAAMVVMAMLGFYFEVARHDRDQFIRVHMRHVRPDKLHHFEKIREDATFKLPYDYRSATHPAWQFWRHIDRTGISTVATFKEQDPDGSVMKALGQHEQLLSDYDIIKINSVYGTECFKAKGTRSGAPKIAGEETVDPAMGESNEPPEESPAPKLEEVEEKDLEDIGEKDIGDKDVLDEEKEILEEVDEQPADGDDEIELK